MSIIKLGLHVCPRILISLNLSPLNIGITPFRKYPSSSVLPIRNYNYIN